MVDYTIRPEDNKEKLDFSAPSEEIVVTIPVETVDVVFPEEFRMMVALDQAIKLKLFGQPGVTLYTDSLQITRPQDLFYIVRLDTNIWKAIRADNYYVENTNREVLIENKILTNTDPIYHFLLPTGGSKNIILPSDPTTNSRFVIHNINKTDFFNLNIQEIENGPVIYSLGQKTSKYILEAIYDGVEWQILLY